jgi:hypothetical protein
MADGELRCWGTGQIGTGVDDGGPGSVCVFGAGRECAGGEAIGDALANGLGIGAEHAAMPQDWDYTAAHTCARLAELRGHPRRGGLLLGAEHLW